MRNEGGGELCRTEMVEDPKDRVRVMGVVEVGAGEPVPVLEGKLVEGRESVR